MRAFSITRAPALLALALALLVHAAAARDVATNGDGTRLPLARASDPSCPWLGNVLDAARASPLVKGLVQRTRMAAPFGPGSWPAPLEVDDADAADDADDADRRRFGWKRALVLAAKARVADAAAASAWLPKNLLTLSDDLAATVFIAWYPDSFCCGAYHEAAIVFDVTYGGGDDAVDALHCPWMLVDKDRSMIAGREILGFPKKLGEFAFTLTTEDGATIDVSDPSVDVADVLSRAARVDASVTREGATLLNMTGALTKKGFARREPLLKDERNVFLNVQTNHPLPPADASKTRDPACLGNRPRLLQFVFDEVVTDDTYDLKDAAVALTQTKTDSIGAPFGFKGIETGGDLDVLGMKIGITNFYTGLEGTPTLGPTVPSGFIENDDVYWLRYQ